MKVKLLTPSWNLLNKKINIIPFNKSYSLSFEEKVFLDHHHISIHPLKDYYYCLHDLSINAKVKAKWVEWGWIFFKSISEGLSGWDERIEIDDLIEYSIQANDVPLIPKKPHVLLIENKVLGDEFSYESFINDILTPPHCTTKTHLSISN